jgi:hypothetical protein
MATGKGTMEDMALNRSFWLDRSIFVTGATGLLGAVQ